ncbi:MAG: prepilin-type N-terminal cleavage/methylation domain-containing protein [Nitrospiria bacterium]
METILKLSERRRVQPQREAGFTLIELILALLVLSIAVIGVTSSMSFTTGQSLNAEVMSKATALAQERIEQLMAVKRDSGYGDPALNQTALTLAALASPYDRYSRGEEICLLDANLMNPDCDPALPNNDLGYKRLTVTVDYNGLTSMGSPVASLVTVITNVRE